MHHDHSDGVQPDGAGNRREHEAEHERTGRYGDGPDPGAARRSRLLLSGGLLALFGALLGYEVLHQGGLEQTALFYVGLPALIAVLVVLTARPRSALGVTMAITTVGLTLAGPLLKEGIVCLVMAAPLFYGVAAVIGWLLTPVHGRSSARQGRHALVAAPLLLLLCLEGVAGVTFFPRESAGHFARSVDAAPSEVAAALAGTPEYRTPRSAFLRTVPFPRAVRARGAGLEVGDRRTVDFRGRTATDMVLEVAESDRGPESGRVVFTVVEDTTLARWLDLREAEVAWSAAEHGTELSWTLRYGRTFDPSWYWGPLQGYGMDRAAGYLADTFAEAAENTAGANGAAPHRTQWRTR